MTRIYLPARFGNGNRVIESRKKPKECTEKSESRTVCTGIIGIANESEEKNLENHLHQSHLQK